MLRVKKILIIAGFLLAWTIITYFFMLRDNTEILNKSKLVGNLDQLENTIYDEKKKSQKLMVNLMGILMTKFQQDMITPVEAGTGVMKTNLVGILPLSPDHPLSLQEPPATVEYSKAIDESITSPKPILTHLPNGQPVIPILVLACNRVSISKCLDNLLLYRPNAEQFPIIVSQDCGDSATKKVILSYKSKLTLIEQPDQREIFVPVKQKKFKGYYKISRHYGWALNMTFAQGYEFVVIVEDDLNVAPDFYEYFLATHVLLKQDPTLWCISAWNDNGKANLIDASRPELLYRTDFFPGLGWMLSKDLWQELSVKWPISYWDDWIREPDQRKNRVCIRPEISRTSTFGQIGVSNGLFYDKYLKYIKLSEDFIEFTKLNLSYLLKDNYDAKFLNKIYTYPIVSFDELRRNIVTTDGPVRLQYLNRNQYKRTTKLLGLMDDFKSGVPRTAYHGIVSFFYNSRRVYLTPSANWKGYDPSWR